MWKNDLKKYQNQLELILKTRNPSHELETNPIKGKPEKNIHEAKFLINKTLRGGIEEKKDSIKKRNKKQIAIKIMMIKFDIKINLNQMLKD